VTETPIQTETNKATVQRTIDEVYIFTFADGRITAAWGLEDTLSRLEQLGLDAERA
jgi:bisphosphoglycerate-independent phosphoglycerate mutase (AlkP superfamily)